MCFAFTNEIPKTVKELDLMSKDAFLQSISRDQNIGKIAITSNYDIPYYVTDNKKIYSFYKWRVKRNLDTIINDTFKILIKYKKLFSFITYTCFVFIYFNFSKI